MSNFSIRQATEQDVPLILSFIRQLAEYERLSHEAVVNEKTLRESLFGSRRYAEVLLGYADEKPVAFAVFFHNFSTFLGRPGLYLEDLFVIQRCAVRGLAGPCWWNWRESRANGIAADSNGLFSIGISRRSSSTRILALCPWMSGRYFA